MIKLSACSSVVVACFAFSFSGCSHTKPDSDRVLKAKEFWESNKPVFDTMDGGTLSAIAIVTFLEMEKGRVPNSVYENLKDIGAYNDTSWLYPAYIGNFLAKNRSLAGSVFKGGNKTIEQSGNVSPGDKSRFIRNDLNIDISKLVTDDEAGRANPMRLLVAAMLYRSIRGPDGIIPLERALLRGYLLKKYGE